MAVLGLLWFETVKAGAIVPPVPRKRQSSPPAPPPNAPGERIRQIRETVDARGHAITISGDFDRDTSLAMPRLIRGAILTGEWPRLLLAGPIGKQTRLDLMDDMVAF
jgi:hypothetical protein